MVKNDEVKNEFDIFGDIWKFYKSFYGSDDWETILGASKEVSKKYNNDEFCNDLLVAVITKLDRNTKIRNDLG